MGKVNMISQTEVAEQQGCSVPKRVLNAGSGPYAPKKLHAAFQGWAEVRLDIDPSVKPDLVGSITDMKAAISEPCYDAIWCSHNLEHLHNHEVRPALTEFRRILKPSGFALITCPDIEAVAQLVVKGQLETPAYMSPVGPITALEMIYGHSASIEKGNLFMAHKTGFTPERLGNVLIECGFHEAWTTRGQAYDLWAVALMPETDGSSVRDLLSAADLKFRP